MNTPNWLVRQAPSDNDPTSHTIAAMLGYSTKRIKKGDIGLEVEVEGNCFPKEEEVFEEDEGYDTVRHELIPDQWNYVHDGSLRGQDNAEYVLVDPIMFDEVPKALSDLWDMFETYGSVLDDSNRTSVHVHLNALTWHVNRVCAFTSMYVALEEVLTNWCGDHRVGNLFCLRAKDAPGIISKARSFFCNGQLNALDDGLHYAGLNLNALLRHGSIEVRTMRGVRDPEIIQVWVDVLRNIYELSGQFPDPRAICETFSGGGSSRFASMVLGQHSNRILSECGLTSSQVNESVRQGVRMAQRLCYARDWGSFKPSNVEADPFGRKISATHLINGVSIMEAFSEHLTDSVENVPTSLASYSLQSMSADWQSVVTNAPPSQGNGYDDF